MRDFAEFIYNESRTGHGNDYSMADLENMLRKYASSGYNAQELDTGRFINEFQRLC